MELIENPWGFQSYELEDTRKHAIFDQAAQVMAKMLNVWPIIL